MFLAIERGEVDGHLRELDSALGKRPDWFDETEVNVLFQAGTRAERRDQGGAVRARPGQDREQKQALEFLYAGQGIGRPFVAPPEMPPERVKMLRDAFAATMKDPEFIADAKKSKLDVDPERRAELEALIKRIYATPKHLVDQVATLIK